MTLSKKVVLYKRLLQVLFALNICLISSGVILEYNYYSDKAKYTNQISDLQERLTENDNLFKSISSLNLIALEDVNPLHFKQELKLFKTLLKKIDEMSVVDFANIDRIDNWKMSTAKISLLYEKNYQHRLNLYNELNNVKIQNGKIVNQIFLIAIFTLFFGVFVPAFIFYKFQKTITLAKKEVEDKISKIVSEWLSSYQHSGDKPFSNPAFWLNIVLLLGELYIPRNNNPLYQTLKEILSMLRTELKKS